MIRSSVFGVVGENLSVGQIIDLPYMVVAGRNCCMIQVDDRRLVLAIGMPGRAVDRASYYGESCPF